MRAHIVVRTNQTGKVYDVRWRDQTGRYRSKTFRRLGDAEHHRATTIADLARGDWIDPARQAETVDMWARRWYAAKTLRSSSSRRNRGIIDNQILPRWEGVPVGAVTFADVTDWITTLRAGGLSASSVKKARDVLSAVLSLAVQAGAIRANPAVGVATPRVERHEQRFLTAPEVSALAGAMPRPDLERLVRVAAATGLRRGELLALETRDVDLDRRRLHVRRAKTDAGVRPVPIPKHIEPLLAAQLDEGWRWVFPSTTGTRMSGDNLYRRYFVPATVKAGVAPLRFHDLRHTYAALMIAANVRLEVLTKWMGHSSITVTADLYGHLYDWIEVEALDRFDRMLDS